MLKIGEFAELSSISIHMLRNYDKIGLLVPSHVDHFSGYRYYDKSQLIDANQIIALKSMGFGLDEIKDFMAGNQASLKESLNHKLQEKYFELAKIKQQINQIQHLLNTQTNLDSYTLSIVRKQLEPMQVVCLSEEIHTYDQEGLLWKKLETECANNHIQISPEALAMSVYHGVNEENQNKIVELQLVITNKKKVNAPLLIRDYKARDVASAIFKGNYNQIGLVNCAIAEWLETNHLEICGQSFTIYHTSPENCSDRNRFITELCFPIKDKEK